jgi:tripartite-type tricarboxylate transporter receptor subunit TctC
LRPLAVNALKRTRSLPDVPTIAEAGYPEALVQAWYGVAAPARTPAPVVAYLSTQFMQTLGLPEVRAKLAAMDAEILDLAGPEFDALMAREHLRWGELIKKRGIKMAT